jgi:hypothetical protein
MTLKTLSSVGGLVRLAGACGLIALAAGVLPGCIIVAGGTKKVVVSEPAIEQSRLDQITLGKTTEAELRVLLGSPSSRVMTDSDKQTWTFNGSPSKAGTTVVYIDKDDDEIWTESVYRGRVTVELTNGLVTAVRCADTK